VLVVAESQVARAEIAHVLKKANGDKWWVEEVTYETQFLSAAVAATAPFDILVFHKPKTPAVVEKKIAAWQEVLGQSAVKAGAKVKHMFTAKPFVVVMEDDRAVEDDDDGDNGVDWNAVGADVVWRKQGSPLGAETAFSLLPIVLPLPLTWRVLAVEDISIVRRMLVRTLKSALGAGCVVVEAASGRDAIAALRVSEEEGGTPFDLLVLDEHLDSQICLDNKGGGIKSSSDCCDEESSTALKGTGIARRVRSGGSRAIIAGFSGDEMAAAQGAAGYDISWRKTVNAAAMRADLLQCLHTGMGTIQP
jgi:CheY-like chemotaxis protein